MILLNPITKTTELPPPEPHQVRTCRYFALIVAAFSAGVGVLVLLGWLFRLPILTSVLPGLATMKPFTALGFVGAGAALWWFRLPLVPSHRRRALALSILVTILGALPASEQLLGLDFGIDDLLFHHALMATGDPTPGRMSLATAFGFIFLGLSLLLIDTRGWVRYLGQALGMSALLDGGIALVGYCYGAGSLYEVSLFSSMALHTSTLMLVLGLGRLAARPQAGLMATMNSDWLGGAMARRILPLAIFLPVATGWIRWQGELAGFYGTPFGLTIFALANVLMFSALVLFSAAHINRIDQKRRRAEESDLRLAAIVQSSIDAIVGKDLKGIITSWNHAAQKLFGYSADEIIGLPFSTLIPPDRMYEEREILDRIRGGLAVELFETIRLKKDGQSIVVAAAISPVKTPDGRVIGASKIARDITEQKRASELFRQQAQALDLTQVLVRDLQGHIVTWTTGSANLYGFIAEQALGQFAHELLQTQFPIPRKEIEQLVSNTGKWEGELIHTCQDGHQIAVSSLWVLQRDAQRAPYRIIECNTDISAQKIVRDELLLQTDELTRKTQELAASERALAAQTRLLQSVLDSISDGLIAADADGHFLLWNPAANRILGQTMEDIPPAEWSRRLGVFLPDEQTYFPAHDLPLAQAIRGHEAGAEMYIRPPSLQSGVWIEVAARPLRNEEGGLVGGVAAFRDITQRKLADREIRKLNAELEQRVIQRTAQLASANQELEAFSYSVSHDLRAPLRHISGFARILHEDFGPTLPEEAQRHLRSIEDGANKMGALITELLNLSRLGRQPLERHPVEVNSLIKEVIAMLEPETAGRQIEWRVPAIMRLECDAILMKQVFQNLISNALKYSRYRPHTIIEIGQTVVQDETVVFVRDNGAGFDMKNADKLFRVFQRLHKSDAFEGIGIGLATVARIIQKHGGRIWAEGEPDRGATFYFSLTAQTPQSMQTATGK